MSAPIVFTLSDDEMPDVRRARLAATTPMLDRMGAHVGVGEHEDSGCEGRKSFTRPPLASTSPIILLH